MKMKMVPMLIAVAIGAVLTYIQHLLFQNVDIVGLIVAGVVQTIWLVMIFGIDYNGRGASVNIKISSFAFFFITMVNNIIFMAVEGNQEFMIVISLLLLLINVGINYSIAKQSLK